MSFTSISQSSVTCDDLERSSLARRGRRLGSRRQDRMSARRRRPMLERLEGRAMLAPVPFVTLQDVPSDVLIGEPAHMAVTLRNSTLDTNPSTAVGYAPYIDLYLPASGFDGRNGGPLDGITLIPGSATYLGAPVDVVAPSPLSLASGGVPHPLAQDSSSSPFNITPPAGFFPGDQLTVLRLPFGSFTPNQPEIRIEFDVMVSDKADVGVALPIYACGGFQFGLDALNNPTADPTIPPVNSTANCASATTTPRLFTLTKSVNGLHDTTSAGGTVDETASGPNFGHQYTITVNVANGQTVTNLQIGDLLPPSLQYVSLVSVSGNGSTLVPSGSDSTPSPTTPGGALSRTLDQVIGTSSRSDAQMTFSFYVSCKDATGGAVINPVTGDDAPLVDTASATGKWLPVDLRDPGPNGTTDHVPITVSNSATHTLIAKSIAVQKSWAVATERAGGGSGPTPGDTLEYTLNFQISDCFAFQGVTLVDTFSDGQALAGSPTLAFTRGGSGGSTSPSGAFAPANVQTVPIGSQGETQITFGLSNELVSRAFAGAGKMLGAGIPNGGGSIANVTAPGTTGVVKFRTTILDSFTHGVTPHTQSVDQGDCLTNGAVLNGEVLNTANLTAQSPQQFENDDSRVDLKISSGSLTKTVYSIKHNGVTVFNPAPTVQVVPGDEVTYRLQYSMPASSTDNLIIEDYLPLPIFNVSSVTTSFGPGDTFHLLTTGLPVVSTNSLNNRVTFTYGSFNDPANQQSQIDLLVAATVSNSPFADGLYLSNVGHVAEDSTNCGLRAQDAMVKVQVNEPLLKIAKGVVATDNPAGVFVPALPNSSFSAPGNPNFRYVGSPPIITSAATILPTLIGSNLNNVDAGDVVTFAIAVENTGSGPNGAFDIRIQDTIPVGFHVPFGGGLNLRVTDGTGAPLTILLLGSVSGNSGPDTIPGTPDDLFGAGLELVDPGPATGALASGKDSSGNLVLTGKNILFITYDLQADFSSPLFLSNPVAACQPLRNTATLLNYASTAAGPNFIPNHLTDSATVTVASVALGKKVIDTSIVDPHNALTEAVIGEYVTYSLTITAPEGTTSGATITDTLGPGLAFVSLVGVTPTYSSASVTSSTFAATPNSTGTSVTFNLGTITNSNLNNNVAETITIFYQAVVLNVPGNQAPNPLHNSAVFTSQYCKDQSAAGADVTIVEPVLQVDKSFVQNGPFDAGDIVSFAVTVSNNGPSTTDAYDVSFSDFIPSGFTYVPNSLLYLGTPLTSSNVTGGAFTTITANWSSFPLNGSGVFLYQAKLNDSLQPCQSVTNQAFLQWTSLPGAHNPGLLVMNNPDATERIGSGIGPNDYQAVDAASVRLRCPTLAKSIVSTSEPSTPGDNVTIGEIVRYQLQVELPEGSYSGLTLQDFLPSYLQWIDPSQVTVTTVNAASFNITAPTSTTGNVSFTFGGFANNDNDADTEFLVVEFNALVTNTPLNTAGDVKPNHFDAIIPGNAVTPATVLSSNVVDVVVVEPQLNVDKQATEVTGDHVTYTITISNTGESTAFDVSFEDGRYNGPAIHPFDLEPDRAQVITYTIPVRPCDDVSNHVAVTASSLPGAHGTQENSTGSWTSGDPGRYDGERIYEADDSVRLTDVGGPCGRINGVKWFDQNGDGVRQPGEQGLGGVTIFADRDGDGLLDPNESFAVTSFDDPGTPNIDETGQYFLELPAGQYQIREISPAGYFGPTNVPGGFYAVSFTRPFPNLVLDFGNTINGIGNFYPGSICGIKFDDLNRDGVRQYGEPLMEGVQFELYADQNADGLPDSTAPIASTLTDANGQYCFTNLPPGKYLVRETTMSGIAHTSANPPTLNLTSSGSVFVAYAGEHGPLDPQHKETVQPLLAFGNDYPARGRIHLCKFLDVNGNGVDDQTEPSLPGVVFELYMLGADGNFHLVATQTTNSGGGVTFTGLLPGTYQVVERLNGTIVTTSPIPNLALNAGQTISFGGCPLPGAITGVKWSDANNSRRREAGEVGIAGVRIYADLDGDGTYDVGEPSTFTIADDPSTPADETGMYTLDGLPPGTYSIREVIPAGQSQTFPTTGSHQVVVTAGNTSLPADFGNRPCPWWNCNKVLSNPLADVTLAPILKDLPIESNLGQPVFDFIGPFYPYPQVPLGYGIAVIGADNAHGMWQFSLDDGRSWSDLSGVSPMSALVLDSGPSNRVRFVPMPGFAGIVSSGIKYRYADSSFFSMTNLDNPEFRVDASRGGRDLPFSAEIGIASIDVRSHEARLTLRTTNPSGQPISSVATGESFVLEGYAQDTRAMPNGVFSAYEDVLYDASLVRVSGPITWGPQFPNAPSGGAATLGLLDEVGGTAGLTANGADPLLLFRIPFTALSAGQADFFNNAAEISEHQVSLYSNTMATPPEYIEFVGAALRIEHSGWQNPINPLDVDARGIVDPIDVLLIINELNKNGTHALPAERPSSAPFWDVNGDRFVAPSDAILVINRLNHVSGGEGEANFQPSSAAAEPDAVAQRTGASLPFSAPSQGQNSATIVRDDFFAVLSDELLDTWSGRRGRNGRVR